MAVPSFQGFFKPVLDELAKRSGPTPRAELLSLVLKRLDLSPEDLADKIPSGLEPRYRNRYNWALWYFKRAGLVTSPTRSQVAITDEGRKFAGKKTITIDDLRKIPA